MAAAPSPFVYTGDVFHAVVDAKPYDVKCIVQDKSVYFRFQDLLSAVASGSSSGRTDVARLVRNNRRTDELARGRGVFDFETKQCFCSTHPLYEAKGCLFVDVAGAIKIGAIASVQLVQAIIQKSISINPPPAAHPPAPAPTAAPIAVVMPPTPPKARPWGGPAVGLNFRRCAIFALLVLLALFLGKHFFFSWYRSYAHHTNPNQLTGHS